MRTVRLIVWTTIWIATLACGVIYCFPRFELIYPPSTNFECNTETIPVMGRVKCPDCILLIGNHTVKTEEDGYFREEVPLRTGENKIDIYLRDVPGNEILKTLMVTRNATVLGGNALGAPLPSGSVVPDAPPEAFAVKQPVTAVKVTPAPVSAKKQMERAKVILPEKSVSESASPNPANSAKAGRNKSETGLKAPAVVTLRPVEFYLNGKQAKKPAADYLFKDNRVYLRTDSALWKQASATQVTSESVVFYNVAPLKQVAVSLAASGAVVSDGSDYVPVREVFEKAGRVVNWVPGKVYIDAEYKPCPIEVGGSAKESIAGVIYKGAIFVQAGSLSKLGIKAEQGKGGVSLLSRGTGKLTVTRITHGSRGRETIIEIRNKGGKSPPNRLQGPASDMVDESYQIPLRKVASELGVEVKWDESEGRVSVLPISVARGN